MKLSRFSTLVLLALFFAYCTTKQTEPSTTDSQPELSAPAKLTIKLAHVWASDTVLKTPESVLFDPNLGVYYVACIGGLPADKKDNDGYIAKLDQKGNVIKLKWITGLHAPKGMGLVGTQLYVTDIDRVVVIDTKESRKIKSLPVKGSIFLNDITVSKDGKIYVSDSYGNSLYTFDGDIPQLLLQDTAMGSPNGLWAEAGGLMCATFGSGEVFRYTFADKSRSVLNKNIPGGDGILPYLSGYLVSNWNGEIYFLDSLNQQNLILDTKGTMNAADIEVVTSQNLVVVPTFLANKVVAYSINSQPE